MIKKLTELLLLHETALWLVWLTVFFLFEFSIPEKYLTNLFHPFSFGILFFWLFFLVIWDSFEIAHHIEILAASIRAPFGTLILTLCATSVEIVSMVNIMIVSNDNPALVRDTIYAILMIVLNGIVGLSLSLGGLRYREQRYNLRGSVEFMSVILVLAVIALILPDFTNTTGNTFSPKFTLFLIMTSLIIYGIFLTMQTFSHRMHFVSPFDSQQQNKPMKIHFKYSKKCNKYHGFLVIAYLIPTLLIAKKISIPIDTILSFFNLPASVGGLIVATLVLAPEAVSAIRASLTNHLQRSVNIALGAVLASTALTIPIVLLFGLFSGQVIILGLSKANITVLVLTLINALVTFASGRANVLQGALHLLLFFAYLMLIFN